MKNHIKFKVVTFYINSSMLSFHVKDTDSCKQHKTLTACEMLEGCWFYAFLPCAVNIELYAVKERV